ncbi:endonuclease SmrB [Ferrimonas marina]|uniref:Ribosome rescue factor SmrB n=1 Tax=Ferrimonas marina TaxID=299255 RepID=A0A1M5Y9P8_9GAMM|nr:endonuclease SmrB [Ferrimonas marina]SHI08775.1 DNA-nicking endonuclease, Smr domain [Ferrimonas marina]
MNKSDPNQCDDFDLFRQSMEGVRPLQQDQVNHKPKVPTPDKTRVKQQRKLADHYFSDSYQPALPEEGPMRYVREGADPYAAKQLRRGDYSPELLLDLHGHTQAEARHELIALIDACKRQQVPCASVMHGLGTGVLKQRVPAWLSQHPDVLAFHQAPLEWGGDGALLILVDVGEAAKR